MKSTQIAVVLSAAVLASAVDDQKPLADEATSTTSATSKVVPQMATFTPTKIKGEFVEQFTSDWGKRWKASHAKKGDTGSEEWAYVGGWAVEEPTVYKGMVGDKGLVVKNAAAHHAISAKFPKPINPKGKPLVVQYEVKLQNGLECGGAYLKLLRENKDLHREEFSNVTPYVIMFGPDKCGSTNKVHFIFNHKNPKSGSYEEKHLKPAPVANIVKTTELYTLIVHPNNTYIIKQNNVQFMTGSLLEDFSPPVNPPAEVDDPEDKKPEDWVDVRRIPDPDAKKPEDWDEDAPLMIVDESATKPEDWLDNEHATIPDPEAQKPDGWDDEEDGTWVPPSIPNPKCSEVSGCGPWEKPTIRNPAYKGAWTAPFIDNPEYKGEWFPRKIPNPHFYEDKNPANFEPIGAIGFEIWTMQNNIMFDNIYIGHSVEDADNFAKETFEKKYAMETALAEEDTPKPPKELGPKTFKNDPVGFVKQKLELFADLAKDDPVAAAKFMPEVAGSLAAGILALLGLIVMLLPGSNAAAQGQRAAAKVQKKASNAVGRTEVAIDDAKKQASTAYDELKLKANVAAADAHNAAAQDAINEASKAAGNLQAQRAAAATGASLDDGVTQRRKAEL